MATVWFFIRIFILIAIGFWIMGLEGTIVIDTYAYEVHMRLWVGVVFIVGLVVGVWYLLRTIGWIHAHIVYLTRTRTLYKRMDTVPLITRGMAYRTLKSPIFKKAFGKQHPLYQVISYHVDRTYNTDITTVLQSHYVEHFIHAVITHNDTTMLADVRAFYATHDTIEMPALMYIYESTVAPTLAEALTHLSYVNDIHLKHEVAYYTAHAHITHNSPDACTATLQAWKSAPTAAAKWRICMACRHIKLPDLSHIVPFEKTLKKNDRMGMVLLAILSTQLQLWGPVDGYIAKAEPYIPADKTAFLKAYVQYKKQGNNQPYMKLLETQIPPHTGWIL